MCIRDRQYRLWIGDGSLAAASRLQQQIAEQQGENERLLERNRILEAEVMELKRGMETVDCLLYTSRCV